MFRRVVVWLCNCAMALAIVLGLVGQVSATELTLPDLGISPADIVTAVGAAFGDFVQPVLLLFAAVLVVKVFKRFMSRSVA